jgi:DNA repair exonuclease SbcCD ATPase subunit
VKTTFKLIAITVIIVLIVAAIGLATGRFLGRDTMTLADLRAQNDQLAEAVATAQAEVTNLKEVNARLQADVAGGRSVEEERRALQTRAQELDRREQNITTSEQKVDQQETKLQQDIETAEQRISEREAKLQQSEKEFYEATNLTQQEIGQAKQIQTEYEAMRQARDEAQKLANRWLVFIWGVSISAFVLLLTAVILAMRYWSVIARHRAETEQRRQTVELLSATLSPSIPRDQRDAIVSSMGRLAGLPDRSTTSQTDA